MKTKIFYGVIGILIGVGALYGYQQFQLSRPSQVRKDLDLMTEATVEISQKSGDFYRIEVHPETEGGGYYVLAKRLPSGHYMNLWRGQSTPCFQVLTYAIPKELLDNGECEKGAGEE